MVYKVSVIGKVIIQDTGGNVGMGISSPSAKLDVNGATKITGDLDVTGTLDVNNRNLLHKIGIAQIGKVCIDSNYAGYDIYF